MVSAAFLAANVALNSGEMTIGGFGRVLLDGGWAMRALVWDAAVGVVLMGEAKWGVRVL